MELHILDDIDNYIDSLLEQSHSTAIIRKVVLVKSLQLTNCDLARSLTMAQILRHLPFSKETVWKAFDALIRTSKMKWTDKDGYFMLPEGVSDARELVQCFVMRSIANRRIFVGHGRSDLYMTLTAFLTDEIEVDIERFERYKVSGAQVIPTLEEMLDKCGFAIIVATGEDISDDGLRARQNVVHETGLFQGRLGFDRVAVLIEKGTTSYSNLSGLLVTEFDPGRIDQTFSELGRTLRKAGFLPR